MAADREDPQTGQRHPWWVNSASGKRGQYVVPYDNRLQQWITTSPRTHGNSARQAATVDRIGVTAPVVNTVEELVGMDGERRTARLRGEGRSRVIEILGHPDDFGVDVEVVIRKHHLPHQFPPEVVEQAAHVPAAIGAEEFKGRRDFRGMDIVTIDGETARDFDDAVWVDKLPNGNYALHVHIADVTSHLPASGQSDRSRGAAARHQRLFSRSRGTDAAPRAFDEYLLPGTTAGSFGAALRPPGTRPPGGEVVSQEFAWKA